MKRLGRPLVAVVALATVARATPNPWLVFRATTRAFEAA